MKNIELRTACRVRVGNGAMGAFPVGAIFSAVAVTQLGRVGMGLILAGLSGLKRVA